MRCVLFAFALALSLLASRGAAAAEITVALFPQPGHSAAIVAVAISPDGRTLATGRYDKTLKLWDIASGCELRTLGASGVQVGTT